MAISWYSEVKDSITPTISKQVVKKEIATIITVHWDLGPLMDWFLGW